MRRLNLHDFEFILDLVWVFVYTRLITKSIHVVKCLHLALNDFRMSYGVRGRLGRPRIEGREVNVFDLFLFSDFMMEFGGIDTSSEKRISRSQTVLKVQFCNKCSQFRIIFLVFLELVLPYRKHFET